jgi:hypothetical protein
VTNVTAFAEDVSEKSPSTQGDLWLAAKPSAAPPCTLAA